MPSASHPEAKRQLFAGLSGPTQARRSPNLTIPARPALAQDLGLAPVFETARMYTGTVPRLRLERVFGVATFELG